MFVWKANLKLTQLQTYLDDKHDAAEVADNRWHRLLVNLCIRSMQEALGGALFLLRGDVIRGLLWLRHPD